MLFSLHYVALVSLHFAVSVLFSVLIRSGASSCRCSALLLSFLLSFCVGDSAGGSVGGAGGGSTTEYVRSGVGRSAARGQHRKPRFV